MSNVDTPVVNAAWLPARVTPVDAVVPESTYGDTRIELRERDQEALAGVEASELDVTPD